MTELVTVSITQGCLRGRKVITENDVSYYSFQGIPYAKPPVGPLRFKAPQPPEPWTGTRDAFSLGSIPPQLEEGSSSQYCGAEDCLFLNVYTPKLPVSKNDPLKAVMVWIYGGSFQTGSGNTTFYEPDHLITGDIVLVTLNYRLGALGFISTEDSEISGNNGLKDQVMALRWVQQNIAQFGGDPGNVTIFGQSAGGACVHYHLLSPMSKGLFHKAIAQSGTALSPWAFTEESRERAFRFGKALGCTTTDSGELVEFLRKLPAQQLVEGIEKTLTSKEKSTFLLYFVPHAEKTTNPEEEVFLTANPDELIAEGKFHKVPFMVGVTSHEGMIFLQFVNENPLLLDLYESAPEILIPSNLKLEKNSPKVKEVIEKIKKFYFGGNPFSKETFPQAVDFYTDTLYLEGMKKAITQQLEHTTSPIYFYQFTLDLQLGLLEKILGDFRLPGACHSSELPYLFKGFYIKDEELEPDTEYMKMVRIMVKLWTNFSKAGNPTPTTDSEIPVKWNPVTKSNLCYLNIGEQLEMQTGLANDRINFWQQLRSSVQNI